MWPARRRHRPRCLGVEDYQMLQLVLRGVSFHASGCLIHRDGDTNELHARAVFLLGSEQRGLELVTPRAPRGPELEEHGHLADVSADINSFPIERANDDGRGGALPYLDADVLRGDWGSERAGSQRDQQRRNSTSRHD